MATDNLTASYNYIDADGDQEKGSEIKWYKDGEHQQAFDNKIIIQMNETAKSQKWHFVITPNDGSDFGETYISSTAVIGNIPPNVSGAYISPEFPKVTDNLSCSYVFNDADSDLEGDTEIKWYKNDKLQESYNNQRIIPEAILT